MLVAYHMQCCVEYVCSYDKVDLRKHIKTWVNAHCDMMKVKQCTDVVRIYLGMPNALFFPRENGGGGQFPWFWK